MNSPPPHRPPGKKGALKISPSLLKVDVHIALAICKRKKNENEWGDQIIRGYQFSKKEKKSKKDGKKDIDGSCLGGKGNKRKDGRIAVAGWLGAPPGTIRNPHAK